MASPEALYKQVKSGKVKLEQLNDSGKAALKSYMSTRETEKKETLVNTGKTVVNTFKKIGDKLGGQLKTAYSDAKERGEAVQADKKAKEDAYQESKTPYEKWYQNNISNTKIGKALGLAQKADRTVSNFKAGALDTATLGATQGLGRAAINNIPGSKDNLKPLFDERLKGTDYKVGKFAGYVAPGALADRAVVKLGGEALKRLPKVAQGFIRGSSAGALDSAAQEGGDVAFREGQFDPLNVALGAGLGGALGAAFPLIGSGARKIIDKYFKGAKGNGSQAPELLALPEPRQRRNINTAETPNVIYQPEAGPRGLPQPSKRFANDFLGSEDAKSGILQMDDELRSINIRYQEAINDQYKLLKEQLKTRGGIEQGNVVRDASGEVVDLFGRTSNNPQWYKDFYAQNGKVPSNKELYELAKRHVDDGYQDEGAFIPSWKVENQFDETVSAIDQVKRTLGESTNVQTQLGVPNVAVGERVGRAPSLNQQPLRTQPTGQQLPNNNTPNQTGVSQTIPSTSSNVTPTNTGGAVLNASPGRQPKPISIPASVTNFNNSGLGNAQTFGSKISRAPKAKKGSLSNWWEKTRTQLVDDLAPLEGLEKRVTGGVASAEDSLYKSGRMFKGTPERAAQVVQDRLSPIIRGIEKSGYSADDLGMYALARHAEDVNAAGLQSGFTNAEINDVLTKFGTPEMEAARQQLVQVNKDMMNELVNNGVVSQTLAATLDQRWKNYIPLFRAFDDEKVEIGAGLSNALANVASPIKALKGSKRDVIDPLENMVKNIFQSVNAAERNNVASKLTRLHAIDVNEEFIRKLSKGEEVGRKNVVNVKVNGENVKYEVEPEVYKALLNLDKESSNMITNILSKPASLLRAGATLTPEFSLRNPMRDVVQAFVVSKSGFNPITDFGAGLIQSIKKGPLYKEWIDNLGAYGNVMSMDRNVHRQALEKVFKEPLSKKFVNIINGKTLIRALRYITDTTESATKVGEYRAALRKGVSKQEAAYRSRDIMDFARAGSGVRQANKMVAFLNANIQGKSKLIRAIKENPTGTITRAFTAVTLPTVGIYALNKQFANDTQRETIDNAPDWMRNSFWLMAIPGTDVVARIPKPFDLAAIFSNLPERALDFAYENDKEAFDGFVSRTLKESALPMQISGLMPFIEGMANYSFFREGDIIPQREQGLEYSDQYDPVRTTETGKLLAKSAEILTGGKGAFKNFSSPRVADNTIQGLTAGLGKYGTDAIDFILKKTGIVDRPDAPEKSIEQKPFAKAFLVDPNQGGKEMDTFYSTIDKLSKEKASNKLNEVTFGSNNLPFEKNSLLKDLNSASDDVSDINKEIRAIEKDRLLTPQQKKMKIDRLITDRKKIVKEAVSLIK